MSYCNISFFIIKLQCTIDNFQSHTAFNIEFITDNLAYDSSIVLHSNGNEQASLSNDGNFSSCVTTGGSEIKVQVDLMEISSVEEIYMTIIGMIL